MEAVLTRIYLVLFLIVLAYVTFVGCRTPATRKSSILFYLFLPFSCTVYSRMRRDVSQQEASYRTAGNMQRYDSGPNAGNPRNGLWLGRNG